MCFQELFYRIPSGMLVTQIHFLRLAARGPGAGIPDSPSQPLVTQIFCAGEGTRTPGPLISGLYKTRTVVKLLKHLLSVVWWFLYELLQASYITPPL